MEIQGTLISPDTPDQNQPKSRNIQIEWLYTLTGNYDEVRIHRPHRTARYLLTDERADRLYRAIPRTAGNFLIFYDNFTLDHKSSIIDLL